jgi:hypothetical protein
MTPRNSAKHSICHHKPTTQTNIYSLAIMSPRSEVFQAIPFDASSDANKPLIAAGDAEDIDHRLEEKAFSRFKFSSLLIGLLVGFFSQFSILGVIFLVTSIWGEDVDTKSKTDIFIFSLLCSWFYSAIAFVILGSLRHLLAITYSAIGGRSKELPEEMVLHMKSLFVVGALVGMSLAWTMPAILLGMRARIVCSFMALLVVAFFCCIIIMMCFATKIKTSSSRRSTAEQTVMAV